MALIFGRVSVRGLAAVKRRRARATVHATFLAFERRTGRPVDQHDVTRRLAGVRAWALMDRCAAKREVAAVLERMRTPCIAYDPRTPWEATVPEFTTQMRRLATALTLALDGARVTVVFRVGEENALSARPKPVYGPPKKRKRGRTPVVTRGE